MSNGPRRVGTGKGEDTTMELTEVLRFLERNTGVFPRKAVEAAMEMRDEMTPELLRILEDTVERADEIVREDQGGAYLAHLYAMFLLAQFRETRAFPLVVRFARLEARLLRRWRIQPLLPGSFPAFPAPSERSLLPKTPSAP